MHTKQEGRLSIKLLVMVKVIVFFFFFAVLFDNVLGCTCFKDCPGRETKVKGDSNQVSIQVAGSNIPPLVRIPSFIVVNKTTTPRFTLDGRGTYDPDNKPNALTYYWKSFKAPVKCPLFDLTGYNTSSPIIGNISTRNMGSCSSEAIGSSYLFILYGCDGQSISWSITTVKIVT